MNLNKYRRHNMSRTYRTNVISLDINHKPFSPRKKIDWWEHSHYDYYSKRNQRYDFKNGPTKEFKRLTKRINRAKVRSAMAQKKYDDIPFFKNDNIYNWW